MLLIVTAINEFIHIIYTHNVLAINVIFNYNVLCDFSNISYLIISRNRILKTFC